MKKTQREDALFVVNAWTQMFRSHMKEGLEDSSIALSMEIFSSLTKQKQFSCQSFRRKKKRGLVNKSRVFLRKIVHQ